MGGWNPLEEAIDFVSDVVDAVVDIVEDFVGWLYPQPDIPDFGDMQQDLNAKGVLVNKLVLMLIYLLSMEQEKSVVM